MDPTRSSSTPARALKTASDVLVAPEWLAVHLYDPDVTVVEIDVSTAGYDDWHIDGAVLWDIYRDLKDPDYRLVARASLEALLARSGIAPETTVVFYGYAPAFGLWLLNLLGHPDTRILNCDRNAWKTAGHPWAKASRQGAPSQYKLGDPCPALRSTRSDVETAIGRPDTTLLDVRTISEYRGQRFWPSGGMEPGGRVGHIPSAVHQPIDGLYNSDGSFRAADELQAIFSTLDVNDPGELITYCTIGGRAATAWFVLTHLLGRPTVSVYDGSWAEWARLPDTPIETPQTTIKTRSDLCPDSSVRA